MESPKKPAKMTNVFAGFSVDTNFCKVKSMENDMKDLVLVSCDGMHMVFSLDVAAQVGIRHGQEIDTLTRDRAIMLSCKLDLATIELNRSINEFNQAEEPKSI
jgi:hypothetical protein